MNAERYIKAIRNDQKRAYAKAFLDWMRHGEQGDPPHPAGLSTMAAQAVRMNLRDYEPRASYNFHVLKHS
jgi:hypothetical protein